MFKIIVSVILLTAYSFSAAAEDSLTGKEIYERAVLSSRLDRSEAVSTMKIIDKKGRVRIRDTKQITKLYDNGKTEKKLIRFLSPANIKGTALMTYDYENKDDDMWLYMPALKKIRRIVSSEKSKSFMGSEFAYSDISPASADDFLFKVKRSDTVDNTECHVVELIPLSNDIADENGFSRKTVWAGKNDYVIRQADFYDQDGVLFKKLTVKNIKLIDPYKKKYRPMLLEMENFDNGRKSILEIKKININRNIEDSYFTERYLSRE